MRNWNFKHTDFNAFPIYPGDDLGVIWTKENLKIRIWAPTALTVVFRLYKSNEALEPIETIPLSKSILGTWSAE